MRTEGSESGWDSAHPTRPTSTGDTASAPARLGDPWVPAVGGLSEPICLWVHLERKVAFVTQLQSLASFPGTETSFSRSFQK